MLAQSLQAKKVQASFKVKNEHENKIYAWLTEITTKNLCVHLGRSEFEYFVGIEYSLCKELEKEQC